MHADSNSPRRLESRVLVGEHAIIERKSMNTNAIEAKFGCIGARVKVTNNASIRDRAGIDIKTDRLGEFFDIKLEPREEVEYEVIDLRPEMRHLLLLARRPNEKQKFLCGHDERHWFVCAVPGTSVTTVVKAMEALQPAEVKSAVRRRVKRVKNRLRRRNKAFVRQGEWFFIPVPELKVKSNLVVKNEPLSRGGGKAHMCQFMYRTGGEFVYVSWKYPNGLTESQYKMLLNSDWRAKNLSWTRRLREAQVFVIGRVSHPDHRTIVLRGWHRVLMNTEREAPGARNIVFLD